MCRINVFSTYMYKYTSGFYNSIIFKLKSSIWNKTGIKRSFTLQSTSSKRKDPKMNALLSFAQCLGQEKS